MEKTNKVLKKYTNFKLNSNIKIVNGILKGLEKKNGHCPCQVGISEDNKCPCLTFRTEQKCCCELFVKN